MLYILLHTDMNVTQKENDWKHEFFIPVLLYLESFPVFFCFFTGFSLCVCEIHPKSLFLGTTAKVTRNTKLTIII